MKEQEELSEEERREIIRKSKRFTKWWVCCYVAAWALLFLPVLPGVSIFLVTAPPVFGTSIMNWAHSLAMMWILCGCACGLWSAVLDVRAKPRRSKSDHE
jgi:hypothetical protein